MSLDDVYKPNEIPNGDMGKERKRFREEGYPYIVLPSVTAQELMKPPHKIHRIQPVPRYCTPPPTTSRGRPDTPE